MGVTRLPWPQRTTVRAGAGLLIGGVLALLVAIRATVPVTERFVVPVGGEVVDVASVLLVAGAFVVLVAGAPGELGVVAGSRLGATCLIGYAVSPALLRVLALIPPSGPGAAPLPFVVIVSALPALGGACLLVGAVITVRAAVLGGSARWALLALGAVELLLGASGLIPVVDLQLWLLSWPSGLVRPLLLVALGVLLLLHGRTEALKHRAAVIHDAW